MKRAEIENMNKKLEQIKELEYALDNFYEKGANHWWKIISPNMEVYIHDKNTRQRFKEFLRNEIDLLKADLSLED